MAGLAFGTAAARPPEATHLADHPRGAQGPWRMRGHLRTNPLRNGPSWAVDLSVDTVFVDGAWRDWPLRVRTTVYETEPQPDWIAGDRFEAFLRLRPHRPARNPSVGTRPALRASGVDVRSSLKSFRQLRRRRRDDDCTWRVLHPSGRWLENGGAPVSNDGSLVLAVACGGRQILLTGDTERAAESDYAANSGGLRSTVLKSPHHGSSTSSSDVLLDAIDTRHAIISVGWRNRFGLLSSEVLERYRRRQIAVYRTDRDDALTIDAGSRIRVRAERWSAGRGRERRGGWLH